MMQDSLLCTMILYKFITINFNFQHTPKNRSTVKFLWNDSLTSRSQYRFLIPIIITLNELIKLKQYTVGPL